MNVTMMNIDEEHKLLIKLIGQGVYDALVEGKALLHIWRRSTPSNWWIATPDRQHDYLWHSNEKDFWAVPKLTLFESVHESKQKIKLWGSKGGMSELSKYRLKALKEDYE